MTSQSEEHASPPPTPPPTRADAPRGRRRGWLRWLLLLLIVGIAAVAAAPTLVSWFGRGTVAAQLESQLGVPVELESMSLGWFGSQRIEALRIASPTGFSQDLLTLESARVNNGLWGLLASSGAVEVHVEGLAVHAERDEHGRFNFDGLGGSSDDGSPGAPEPPKAPGGTKPADSEAGGDVLRLPELPRSIKLTLTGSRFGYVDKKLQTTATVKDVEATFRADNSGAQANFAAQVAESGSVQASLNLAGGAPLPQTKGSLSAQIRGLSLQPYRGLLEERAGVLAPEQPVDADLKLTLDNGRIDLAGESSVGSKSVLKGVATLPLVHSSGALTLADGKADAQVAADRVGKLFASLPQSVAITDGSTLSVTANGLHCATTSEGAFDPSSLRASVKFSLADGGVKASTVSVDSVEGELRVEGGVATLQNTAAQVNGGSVEIQEGRYDLTQTPAPFSARLAIRQVGATYEMAELLQYAVPFLSLDKEHAELSGKLNLALEVNGRGLELAQLQEHLTGSGQLRLNSGTVSASRLFHSIADLLGGELANVAFSEIGSDFNIGDGRIAAGRVYMTPREGSKVRNLGLKGSTGLDQTLDFGVDLAALDETVGDKKISRVLQQAQKLFGDNGLPLRLGGKLSAPALELAPAAKKLDVGTLIERLPGVLSREKDDTKESPSDSEKGDPKKDLNRVLDGVLEGVLGGRKKKKDDE